MRRRLILYFLAVVSATLIGVTIVAVIGIRSGVIHRNAEHFSKLAEEVYYNVDRLVRSGLDDARLIAENPLISDETSDRDTLRIELLKFRRMLPLYEDISIIAPNGTVIVSTDFAGRGDWSHKKYFLEALGGHAAVSNVHFITEPIANVIGFAAPIRSGDRVIAVAVATLNIKRIAELVEHLRFGRTGHAFVLDQSDTIIIHRDGTRLLEPAPRELAGTSAMEGVFFTERGIRYFGSTFVQEPGGTDSIPHWKVVVAQEEQELFAALRAAIMQILLMSLVLLAISFLVATHFSRRLTHPLNSLMAGISRIRGNDLDVVVPVTTDDEIGELAQAFNRMVGDLRESKKLLVSSEKRYREMADMMPQTLFETDLKGLIVYSNRAGYTTYGYTEEDVRSGKSMLNVLLPSERERAIQRFRMVLAGSPVTGNEYLVRKSNGEIIPAFIYSAPRYENERLIGIRGIVVDLSEVKKAEAELKRKELQLIQAQKMESIGTLAGGLAHDFNNVLGGIGGAASLLSYLLEHDEQNASPEKMREYLALIESQVKRASEMIRQLLALSRGQEIAFAPMDLIAAITQVAAICEKTFEKSVQLRVTTPPGRALINGDAALFEQVLLNLMVNAWHAMTIMRRPDEKQGGICAVTLERVAVEKNFPDWPPDLPTGDYWSVRIADSGVGIEQNALQRIFDPFYSTKAKGSGSGLGLPMAYNIIRQHHGCIKVSSLPGKGSVFTLFLPMISDTTLLSADRASSFIIHSGTGTALLADDEPAIRETTAEMLEMMGYRVVIATDGVEAVELFRERQGEISFLILDLLMPRLSGIDALREIRRLRPDIKALIISGYRFDERVQEAVSWGGLLTLQKPFTVDQFTRAVKELTV